MTSEQVRARFDYNLETGDLIYRRGVSGITPGRVAGQVFADGYRNAWVCNKLYKVHLLVWLWHHEPLKSGEFIDHIDGNPGNNRIENLRAVSHLINQRNKKRFKNNTSGHTGVRFLYHKWHAFINVGGNRIHLGKFEKIEDAVTARKHADTLHGFHPNHGR